MKRKMTAKQRKYFGPRRRRSVKRRVTKRRLPSVRLRRERGRYLAVRAGGRYQVLLAGASGLKRVGTYTMTGLKRWAAKHHVKLGR